MPTTALKHFAKKSNHTLADVEHKWAHAKKIVKDQYDLSEDDPSFWALTTGVLRKMLGLKESISFKDFINEAAVGEKPTYTSVQIKEAIKLLNTHCKDALWMLTENKPLWRGDDHAEKFISKTGFATVDPSKTVRKSQNTKNYYTMIFDNHPKMVHYPKRSKSFITTTEGDNAAGYADNPFMLVPYDGVKMGVVNSTDMWANNISLFDSEFGINIERVNTYFDMIPELKSGTSWEDWEQFDKKLKAKDKIAISNFNYAFDRFFKYDDDESNKKYQDNFINEVRKAYDPGVLGFTCHTTKTLGHNLESEVWVGGPCMLISMKMWDNMVDSING